MRDGVVLLALYVLLYPPNYPQIGKFHFKRKQTNYIR
jgi:hypothetical protein